MQAELISAQGRGREKTRVMEESQHVFQCPSGLASHLSLPPSQWLAAVTSSLVLSPSHRAPLARCLLSTCGRKVIFGSSTDTHHSWDFKVSHPPAGTQAFSSSCWLLQQTWSSSLACPKAYIKVPGLLLALDRVSSEQGKTEPWMQICAIKYVHRLEKVFVIKL